MGSGVRLGSTQAQKGEGEVERRKARKRGNGKGAPVGVSVTRVFAFLALEGKTEIKGEGMIAQASVCPYNVLRQLLGWGTGGWGGVGASQDHSYGEA